MRRIGGIIIGVLLCFPGALALQAVSNELGVYQDMTLTEALLMIIIVLACALLFGQPKTRLTADEISRQADKMELASRRIQAAQLRNRAVRRTVEPPSSTRSRRSANTRRRPR